MKRTIAAAQMEARLKALLAERFQLSVHRETKEQPVYALMVRRVGGSKLQPAKEGSQGMMRMGRGQITAEDTKIQMLASSLANMLGRPVIDKTGLTANLGRRLRKFRSASAGTGCSATTRRQRPIHFHRHAGTTRAPSGIGERSRGDDRDRPRGEALG